MIQMLVGFSVIAVTVGLHATATSIIASILRNHGLALHTRFKKKARPFILGFTATCLSIKHYLDILIWAAVFRFFVEPESISDFENAVYFSSVNYTGLGFGDIVLYDRWRLLCGIEAMNGILLFGWSTALLFFIVQIFWSAEARQGTGDSIEPADMT